MRTFETFRLTVRRSERYGVCFAIHARMAGPHGCELPRDSTYEQREADYAAGERAREPKSSISFYQYLPEFVRAFERGTWPTQFADGYHKAEVCGDSWTFYDWEGTTKRAGKREVAYRMVDLPRQVVRVCYRYARLKARALPCDTDHDVELPLELRERLLARYGQGTGQVRLDISDSEAAHAMFDEHIGTEDFDEQLLRLIQIARNTTTSRWQVATVRLGYDFAGFGFSCLDPQGRAALHGGLIYHRPGRETFAVEINAPSGAHWSIHT